MGGSMQYRLGLDVGTNSIGWAVIALDEANKPFRLVDAGVRIFSDGRNPKDKTSLAVARRAARAARRRRDRFLRRRRKLLRVLTEYGLLPVDKAHMDALFDPAHVDPYALRAKGLDHALHPHEFGRVIFHLNQRRGFKSNRKSDGGDAAESGKIKVAVNRLQEAIEANNARTLGEYLHQRRVKSLPVRVRMRALVEEDGKTKDGYDFYPDRRMVEEEFEALWEKQSAFHPDVLTSQAKAAIADALFFQRPLRPVRPGKCTFNPEEERLSKAHPLFQKFRIYQEANQLMVGSDYEKAPLSREDRDKVVMALLSKNKCTFGQLRKVLNLPNSMQFNLESDVRKHLDGDQTSAVLSDEKRFGVRWRTLSDDQKVTIVDRLLNEQDEETLVAWLMAEFSLTEAQAKATANAPLPDGYGNIGLTAVKEILAQLQADVVVYSKACERAGYRHSDFRTGEIVDQLPYYGKLLERHIAFGSNDPDDPEEIRYGRIANPTVHIGLNQLRKVVNAIIRRYGHPQQIIVELARSLKLNKKQKDAIKKAHKENTDRAERHRKKLEDLRLPDTGENRLRLRLWEELNPRDPSDRRCPYTLEQISIEQLFTAEVDIDHILPFSRTLDNSAANRTVCKARANKAKGNKTPYERFGDSAIWTDILDYARNFPKNKSWRFAPNAMEQFEGSRGFLDRQLTDTQYLARITREYLTFICNPNEVWVSPGRLTALLRRFWGLDSLLPGHNLEATDGVEKVRTDHRHHTIDAIVIGLTDRSLLNRLSSEAARSEDLDMGKLMADVPVPWPTLRDDVRAVLGRMIVSYRPDRKSSGGRGLKLGKNQTSGRLHNDTAYGIIAGPDKRGAYTVIHRVPWDAIKDMAAVEAIRDAHLREKVIHAVKGLTGKEFQDAIKRFATTDTQYKGIRHVRIVETLSVIPIRNKHGKIYKAYKGDANERFDIWQLKDGKWQSEVVSTFDANQKNFMSPIRRENPTAKKVMSLRKDDLLAWVEEGGETKIMRVVKFSTNGSMQLAPHNEAGNLKARDADKEDYFRYINTSAVGLKNHMARQVRVDELGRVFDPGPRA
jgi:CRISPR-associated endonuclease Csn1